MPENPKFLGLSNGVLKDSSKPLKAALWIASKMRWWLRALLYVGLAIFFVAMCFGIGNLVSMFMLGGGGVLYGIGSFQHKRNTGGALF
ncbi:Oidioi.mRNA.OKI2018_I69.chr2.g4730.t2.cds [Oikopleura dioica]|uniref:Oidioi.mRNA.OKI2018_I69.chr2.g4730.t2.cds n=1 Tax=Oikopleura dioica TaxID=34765 RepID=A0ABN7SXZ4_OIKDI|nr:Oidioi.mRNA.OKI2018_I69.chr2.g4730.t2.cds [Oikopleura dioica]